jgi:peptidoglycan/LPS O-acetylase OafA/YrhL
LQPNLPGLFENNTIQAFNGALWTLKIEVMFYLLVPFAVMTFHKFGRFRIIIALYIVSILYSLMMLELARRTSLSLYGELQRQLPGQLTYFISGALGYYYFQYLKKYGIWLMVASTLAFAFQARLPWISIEPIALAIIVIYFATVFPHIGNFGKFGDFSYGIYIVHFPILQMTVSLGFFKDSPWLALGFASSLIIMVAFFLWHLIEKPFLRKSSHYVAASHG